MSEASRRSWYRRLWWERFAKSWGYIGQMYAQPSAGFAAVETSRARSRFIEVRSTRARCGCWSCR